ncbi:MAG: T9SS type A sorting domain-containing protein [Fluviicola sp.]|nr:T9SS type A sorting domain-containing protein [Fluviicola sp.]
MKSTTSTLFSTICLFFICNCLIAQPVVTYPNGGETLTAGSTVNITWTGTALNDVVGIDYTIDNWTNTVWLSTNYQNPSANSYSWTIPNVSATQCKVGIFNVNFNGDISDGFFTITGSASISETDFNELITVFPNPATDLIQVINTTNSPLLFQLMDQLGRQVVVEIFQTDAQKSVLRNPGLPCGIYTLVITTADGIDIRKKIVVE